MRKVKFFAPLVLMMTAIIAVMTACARSSVAEDLGYNKKPDPTDKTIGEKATPRPADEVETTVTDETFDPIAPPAGDLPMTGEPCDKPDDEQVDEHVDEHVTAPIDELANDPVEPAENGNLSGWDLREFLDLYQLDCRVTDTTIEIYPADHSFLYTMLYDNGMVRGNRTAADQARHDGGVLREYSSATDFIFNMFLDNKYFKIGADELDVLYVSIRMLTVPLDQMAQVRDEIAREYAEAYNTEGIPEAFVGDISE